MSKIETLTVNTIRNLEDVWFESVDSGLYIMNGTMKNGFTIRACNGQRSQQSHDGRFYAITTVDEVGIKEFKKDEIQLHTPYGYFKNQRDCQECIDFFKEQIDFLEID